MRNPLTDHAASQQTLDPSTSTMTVEFDEFGYFRFFEPTARIGHSIHVYHISAADVARYDMAYKRAQHQ